MIYLSLKDEQWPFEYISHDRQVVRAVVYDEDDYFYFVKTDRDDIFGKLESIETAGGGIEENEDEIIALKRELKEELGAEVEIIEKLAVIDDYYNLLHRHNINHYYLCKALSFGERHLTRAEIMEFHLSVIKLSYKDACALYRFYENNKLGCLLARREVPVLEEAERILKKSVD